MQSLIPKREMGMRCLGWDKKKFKNESLRCNQLAQTKKKSS
jgi:hypothetical protein